MASGRHAGLRENNCAVQGAGVFERDPEERDWHSIDPRIQSPSQVLHQDYDRAGSSIETVEGKANEAKEAEAKLKLMGTSIEKWNWQLVHSHIPHSRVNKMWQASEKRMEISAPTEIMTNEVIVSEAMSPTMVWMLIKNQMVKDGGKEMQGLVPMGDLERKVQDFLDTERSGFMG